MPRGTQPHLLLLAWLLFVCTLAFGLYLAHDQGLIAALFAADQSKLSIAVALVFGLGCLHCAARIVTLSTQVEQVTEALDGIRAEDIRIEADGFSLPPGRTLPDGPVSEFLEDLCHYSRRIPDSLETEGDISDLTDIFADRLKRSHEYGWYAVDILVKLGLLGTIIGFILMLGSIAETTTIDVNAMQKVLTQMSRGMGTALYTTLAGLTASILLGAQYLMADKGADALMERVLKFAHLSLTPAMRHADPVPV
jgi:hypothetical protein